MKRVVVFVLFLQGIISIISAQHVYSAGVKTALEFTELTKNFRLYHQSRFDYPDNVEGSPYIFEEFREGDVYLSDSSNIVHVFHLEVNKNGYSGHFEFNYDNKRYAISNEVYDSIVVKGEKYIPVWSFKGEKTKGTPMKVISFDKQGNYLVKQVGVRFFNADDVKPFVEAKPARFKPSLPKYFLYINGAELIGLKKLRKLDRYDFTPKDYREFLRVNRISGKDEADLRLLFAFLFCPDNNAQK